MKVGGCLNFLKTICDQFFVILTGEETSEFLRC